ncbi:Membrane associated serine protease, rhomboid family [Pustulibacterium marinum]|uniref:Membrane associated serine protease, rhomboid family n=1 Tax=Pustulibacterium marinum TaxID=1224947 RepID=A0A1I7F5V3_9FLAO|nr:rhomboid family intramembrane serine protease [Pustulibacterium marinum]SFU31598.1 Membrane associated serine protease, rhomboid family [Pustulibacterium marinum]
MKNNSSEDFKFYNGVIIYPFLMILIIWSVFYAEVNFHWDAVVFGVYPRTFPGLIGVITSPFVHGSLSHLYNNTLPLLILGSALFYFYPKLSWKVVVLGWIGTGFLTWLIGRSSYHIGASGLIYLLTSFLFFKGILTKYFRLVAVSLIVVFVYGSTIWYLFPIEDTVSWEGHLAGFITGLILAFILKANRFKNIKRFDWEHPEYNEEDDVFMRHFDSEGNFVPESEWNRRAEEEEVEEIDYIYIYKKSSENHDKSSDDD